MDCSTPVLPVLHHLPELAELMSIESFIPSNHLILCHLLLLLPLIFPSIRIFSNELVLPSGGQSIGASATTSVLPMNIHSWFPLGLTCLISLLSKVSQKSSPAPLESISSLVLSLPYGPTLTSIQDYWKNHSLQYGPGLFTYWGPAADHSHGVLTKGTCDPRLGGVSGDCVSPHLHGSKSCAEGDHIHKTKKKGRIRVSFTCI